MRGRHPEHGDRARLTVPYIEDLAEAEIVEQIGRVRTRLPAAPGTRQEAFLPIETLLCYGLFFIFDPHRYGGGNIDSVPAPGQQLAAFFKRTTASVLNKMLNLDGSRVNSARAEPLLFATLSAFPGLYGDLYRRIIAAARALGVGESDLPDFLAGVTVEALLGGDDLPDQAALVALAARAEPDIVVGWEERLSDLDTERLVLGRARTRQLRFARDVLGNCGDACVFCGFKPASLPPRSGLLRASHIKPWAAAEPRERVDARNGVAACPLHDAAFDEGHITVLPDLRIVRSAALDRAIAADDPQMRLYFQAALAERLILPPSAKRPTPAYLDYHRHNLFLRDA